MQGQKIIQVPASVYSRIIAISPLLPLISKPVLFLNLSLPVVTL